MATLLGAVSGERLVLLKLNTVRSTVVRQTQTNSTLGLSNGIHRLKTVDKLMVRNAWDTRELHDISSAGLSVNALAPTAGRTKLAIPKTLHGCPASALYMLNMLTSLTVDHLRYSLHRPHVHGGGSQYTRQLVEGIDCRISVVITPPPNPSTPTLIRQP